MVKRLHVNCTKCHWFIWEAQLAWKIILNHAKPQSGFRMVDCMKPDIRNFVSSGPKMTSQRHTNINKKLAAMCALDYCPISIVNGEGCKRFVETLDPSYTVPSHSTIRSYVHRSYVDAKDKIKSVIKSTKYLTHNWPVDQPCYSIIRNCNMPLSIRWLNP